MKTKYVLMSLCLMSFFGCELNTPLEVTEKPKEIVYGSFTDARDGITYKTIQIGNQTWMAENLRYMPEVYPCSNQQRGEKRYYVYGYDGYDVNEARAHKENDSRIGDFYSNQSVWQHFGTLYNYTAAQTAAPDGWRLPTDDDFNTLRDYLSDNYSQRGNNPYTALLKLSSRDMWNDQTWQESLCFGASGFDAMPTGSMEKGICMGIGEFTYYWLDEGSSIYAYYVELNEFICSYSYYSYYSWRYQHYYSDQDFHGYSIRCIKK